VFANFSNDSVSAPERKRKANLRLAGDLPARDFLFLHLRQRFNQTPASRLNFVHIHPGLFCESDSR
jgi:hypothetical protein